MGAELGLHSVFLTSVRGIMRRTAGRLMAPAQGRQNAEYDEHDEIDSALER